MTRFVAPEYFRCLYVDAEGLILIAIAWLIAITVVHAWLNLHLFASTPAANDKKLRIGFLPVTCHLTCPVTDFMTGDSIFDPVRFNCWPELKKAYLSGYTSATFILAPMAMALREQGVPIKIVYLGHRDGTAMIVHKDSQIFRIEDLRGKTILFVTHDIEEAVQVADRVLIITARPGTIQDVVDVDLPRPRHLDLTRLPRETRPHFPIDGNEPARRRHRCLITPPVVRRESLR